MKTTFYKNTFLQIATFALILGANVAFAPTPQMTLEDIPGPQPSAVQPTPQAVERAQESIQNEPANESIETQVTQQVPNLTASQPGTTMTTIIAPLARPQTAAAESNLPPMTRANLMMPHPLPKEAPATTQAAETVPASKPVALVPSQPAAQMAEQPAAVATPKATTTTTTITTVARTGEALPTNVQQTSTTTTTEAAATSHRKMLMFNALATLALIFLAVFNYFLWRSTRKQQGVTDEQLADARKALEEVNRVATAGEKPARKPAAARTASAKIGKEDAA